MKASFNYRSIFWSLLFGYFFYLMFEITVKYIPVSAHVAFLNIKQTEVTGIPFYLPVFYVHVLTSIFCLLAGFTQFNNSILNKRPDIHRLIGKLYVGTILLFAAPSGLFIGLFANGGLFSRISFIVLALLWFYFTLKAFTSIKQKDILSHQKFMYRSFALTCSAITLRLWKVIIVYVFQPSPMDVYQIIAWLGWIPNILIIEYYIAKKLIK
ncbi:DUF2306 domain-containing protein [Flavobacterium amniphilum]|uniref:DUF2306 domain-containing protein n=1 Tax=Flavobacterium amniphilum TaxID=1834035 RepID=UPI00202A2E78|nr:DUF2306 domain-containing protein [Flavobacterium amniphilum]MCL9807267.1 DUF2306 domain-containing protein [Flavobacterium amniphilum]